MPSTSLRGPDIQSFASRLAGAFGKVLFFSPADDRVYPRKSLCAAIEKGKVSVSLGAAFLSKISVKGSREYVFDGDRYPAPEDVASSTALAAGELRAGGADLTLSLPREWAIVREVEFPSTVKENLPDVVRYEMDRITPIAPDEAYYDFRVIGEAGGRLTLLVVAAKADKVAPYISAMGQKGIRVSSLDVQSLNDKGQRTTSDIRSKGMVSASVSGVCDALMPEGTRLDLLKKGVRPAHRIPYILTLVLALCIGAMAAVYAAAPLRIENSRLKDISAQVSTKKEEARKVETLQKDLDALAAEIATINNFKTTEPIALNIVKEVTSVMPKTAWLSRLRVTETTVEIEGYAASANELLPKLEASKYLRKVEVASPTFRDPRTNMDRFVIRMEIEGAKKIEPTAQKPEAQKNEKK